MTALRCEVCGQAIAAAPAKGCVPGDCVLQRIARLYEKPTLRSRVSTGFETLGAFLALAVTIIGLALIPALVVGGIGFAIRAGWMLAAWVFR